MKEKQKYYLGGLKAIDAALLVIAVILFAFIFMVIGAKEVFGGGYYRIRVNLEDKLEEMGATDINVVDGAYIIFNMGKVKAQLLKADEDHSMLYISSGDEWIPAFIEQKDSGAKIRYVDNSLEMCLTDTQIRCLDYAAYTGEFFQKKSGEYHAVYDDIGIWLNGTEPPDYDYGD